ncbi:MAG: AsmA family protein [Crocinitomicaceae bacterium]|nr:AsmA family protein [Crocinitomicaceae bacterium]
MLRKKKFWLITGLIILLLPLVLITGTVAVIYYKQEDIVQKLLKTANEEFQGKITLENSHIAPFANFPYISIDLKGVRLYETKEESKAPILTIQDVYVGFDLWTLVNGNFDIKSIKIAEGLVDIVADENGEFNIQRAFIPTNPKNEETESGELFFALESVYLNNLEIDKTNADATAFEVFVERANIKVKSKKDRKYFSLNTNLKLTTLKEGDTTFFNNKLFATKTTVDYDKNNQLLYIPPSDLMIGGVQFEFGGTVDFANNVNLDLNVFGQKPDFSLLLAFVPNDLAPVFQSFDNRGQVFFKAQLNGPSSFGNTPLIEAEFGCKEGFFHNTKTDKILDQLNFTGFFTNGSDKTLRNARIEINDFSARPEQGRFSAHLKVSDLTSPDIDLRMRTLFDLDYLTQFLNLDDVQNVKGRVELEMNFRDIIDLNNPEKSIEKLNESYFTRLNITQLAFDLPNYKERIENINLALRVDGNRATLENLALNIGGSDLRLSGYLSDLPAIIHQTNIPVQAELQLHSNNIDLLQLTSAKGEKSFNELIKDLEMQLAFQGTAKDIIQASYLPKGNFSISNLNAKLTNYPHALKDFQIHVAIDSNNLNIKEVAGKLDESDFSISAKLINYPVWFYKALNGTSKLQFHLKSNHLNMRDLITFNGHNYLPSEYREEEFKDFDFKGNVALNFNNSEIKASTIDIQSLRGRTTLHPLKLENFSGKLQFKDDYLSISSLKGKMGNTSFYLKLNYFLGEDLSKQNQKNELYVNAPHLDFNQLFIGEPQKSNNNSEELQEPFSIFNIPIPNMTYTIRVGKMNYQQHIITNLITKMRKTNENLIHMDKFSMDIAGGNIQLSGYFNASDPDNIYFYPKLSVNNINIANLMLKYDNFGQESILSEQLQGTIDGKITGKVKVKQDLVPIIDNSKIKLDILVKDGCIIDYAPMQALSNFFDDRSLSRVIFDTLQNNMVLENGKMTIPEMVINSNLGFIVISGEQTLNGQMNYLVRVPLRMVSAVGARRLFGSRSNVNPEELADFDPNRRYRFINVRVTGDGDNIQVNMTRRPN